MDSERIQKQNQAILDITVDDADQTLEEVTADEAQKHTEEVFEQMFEELGAAENETPDDKLGNRDRVTERLPDGEINPDADISEETDMALFELEEAYDKAPSERDEKLIKLAQASDSRYHERIIAEDKKLSAKKRSQFHGVSKKDDDLITAWSYIKAAKAGHQIIRDIATIVSAEEFRTKSGETQILAGVMLEFPNIEGKDPILFHAYMKLDELFVNPPARVRRGESMSDRDYNNRCKMAVSYMIGAKIPVVIQQALYTRGNTNPFQIIVSRREALLHETVSFFATNPKTGEVRTNAGDVVTAKVVSVGAYSVVVNVRGIDCTATAVDLTCRPVTDCRKEFAVNDEVKVEITEITWPEDLRHKVMLCSDYDDLRYTLENAKKNTYEYQRARERMQYNKIVSIPEVSINGSRYEATMLYNKYSSEIRIGTLTTATVENVYYNEKYNRPAIRVYLDKFRLVGYAQSVNFSRIVGALEPGARVTFQIDGVNQKNTPFLVGRIMNIIPSRST